MNKSKLRGRAPLFVGAVTLAAVMATFGHQVSAQGPGRGGQQGPPPSPWASAAIDLTGYWVSVVNEDWRWRMVTPPKGDYASVPMTDEARKVADTWDVSKDGQSKLLKKCTLPLTGERVVDMVITELGVFAVDKRGDGGVTLVELADGVSVDEVKARTQAKLTVPATLKAA